MTKIGETLTVPPGEHADPRHALVSRRAFLEGSTGATAALVIAACDGDQPRAVEPARDGDPAEAVGPWRDGTFWDDGTGWIGDGAGRRAQPTPR